MFEFLKDKATDEHATQPGAANPPPDSASGSAPADGSNSGSVAASQSLQAGAEARAAMEASPRRRGRPPKNSPAGGGNSEVIQHSPELQTELQKALDAAYAPESWGALLGAPFDGMAAITGRDRWELSKEERKTMGVTAGACARTLSIQDPRLLLFTMLAASVFSAVSMRAIADIREHAEKKRAQKKPDA